MNNLIKISKLNKSFEGIKKINVLKNISYNFKKGKIYSLMGPSGSGKSTLLNLLSLIDRPTSGSITFENKKINYNHTNENDILRANKIGIIYQQDNLLPDFTSLENIYLAALAGGCSKVYIADILAEKLKMCDHYPDLIPVDLSKETLLIAFCNIPEKPEP